jgi:hypothetical protein
LDAVFFTSFLAIVFFCLGNSVLAVCYYWFEMIMKKSMLIAGLQHRFSLITAFYYMETNGTVQQDDFLKCADLIRKMTPGKAGSLEGDVVFFKYLDANDNGVLSLTEFFRIGELVSFVIAKAAKFFYFFILFMYLLIN